MPQWDPERTVDETLARRLLAEQFPELAAAPIRPLGAGWDNTVHLVADEWVFRFPRREMVLTGLETEIAVLPVLAPLLPVPIPVPVHVGVPAEPFPWPWFGARMLPGVELCEAPGVSRDELAPQLGRFLRTLHSATVLDEVGARLAENETRRADMQVRVPVVLENLGFAADLWQQPPDIQPLLDEALELPPPEPRAVCHGDLHFRHVLVEGNRMTGVIDWIDLCRGDPALDLQLVWSVVPPEARDAFFAEYGEVDGATLLRARVVALHLALILLLYGSHEGLAAIEREARASLDRLASP